jgi:hypothetical protein
MAKGKSLKNTLMKYEINPSISKIPLKAKAKKVFTGNGEELYITNASTGEVTPATGGAVFVKRELVDDSQFIKIYSEGIKQLAELNTSGYNLFQLVFKLMLENPNQDRLVLNYGELYQTGKYDKSQMSFIRGINELLAKEIIYQSLTPHLYFLNISLFYNGDRITTLKVYERKKDLQQLSLLEDNPE